MSGTDTSIWGNHKKHIRRKEPSGEYDCGKYGMIPYYHTLCGLDAIVSSPDEKNPTCKRCIKIRRDKYEDRKVPTP